MKGTMRHCREGRWLSNPGFSNHQALLALLVAFPLGLIALGLLLNVLDKPSLLQPTAKPASAQTQNAKPPPENPASNELGTAEQMLDNSIITLGASVSREPIRLLINSIQRGEREIRSFTYQLGDETIEAMANCRDRSWISYPERSLNRPQSPATRQMLALVCDGNLESTLPSVAIVYDPPSNFRVTPNGALLCTIESRRSIRVGQPTGDWYSTAACDREGFIHRSQLQF